MKRIIFTIMVLSVFVASCSKSGMETGSEIRFDLNFAGQTRATANAFEQGDVVGLYMTEYEQNAPVPLQVSGNAVNNAALTLAGQTWSANPALYWEAGIKYDAYGYYPYGSPASVDEYRFSVAADQSVTNANGKPSGYEASDFLWAKAKGVKYPNPVSLTFQHKMSGIVVNLVKGEDFEGDMPENTVVKIHGTVIDALIDLGSGTVTKDPHGKTGSITMRKEGPTTFSAIVVPQRIDSKQPLFEVISGNVSYLTERRFAFRSGVRHTVNIIINRDPEKVKIEIGGEIKGWN